MDESCFLEQFKWRLDALQHLRSVPVILSLCSLCNQTEFTSSLSAAAAVTMQRVQLSIVLRVQMHVHPHTDCVCV